MSTPLQENGRLDGWKAISDHLGWHVRTVMRWEQHRGLPVHRVPGGQRHAVYAFPQELNEWLQNSSPENDVSVEGQESPRGTTPSVAEQNHETSATERTQPGIRPGSPSSNWLSSCLAKPRNVIWITVSLGLVAILGYTVKLVAFPARILFTDTVQLTNDGQQKIGLVTDGRAIYFGEHKDSRIVLSSISVDGGPVREIPTPFVQVVPVDASPDGKSLLVLAWEGIESERVLWIVSLSGAQPHQVGSVRCHAAAWSPDGRKIAFASQHGIYLTTDDGTPIERVQSFDGTPEFIRWSPDGNRLRFDLRGQAGVVVSYWELTFSDRDNASVSSLVPLQSAQKGCWANSMTLDEAGSSFIGGGKCDQESIYLLTKHPGLWSKNLDFLKTNSVVNSPRELALDRKSRRVFVVGDYAGPQSNVDPLRLDVLKLDIHSLKFSPFLPGLSADYVDFSRQGNLIAYIQEPDQSLWISRSDGNAARQIANGAGHLELPRWSPDGRWLAFMAHPPGRPWRIYLVPTNGGNPREASSGLDGQGAPTWSPDGKWLAYGNVECEEEGTCAVHKIEVSTGREYSVPGSEGLGTARWSPDGKYIAALNPVAHAVLVFDERTQRWSKLLDNVNGNDLSWSADSQFIYASRPTGNQPEVLRISLKDSKTETVADLRPFVAQAGQISRWFALTPDGSILFSRDIHGNEIFSLSYAEK